MGQRLAKLLPLFETDQRVQVIFTAAPHAFGNGVAKLLRELDGAVISWEQAIATPFDLALASGYPSVHELRAPLIVVPHGAAHNKLAVRTVAVGTAAVRGVYGLDREHLVQGGRVVPQALVLSHRADLAVLGRQCPAALPAAEVVGDPCYDEIAVSRPFRTAYRRSLGVADGKRLVVTASTWGTGSLFGRHADLHDRLLAELDPDKYEMVALLHPNVWYGHGPRQVRSWLSGARQRGLALLPPDSEWLGALIAADVVIGDAGSSTVYATAANTPVIIGTFPGEDVAAGTPAALLAGMAPKLQLTEPIEPQLAEAMASYRKELFQPVAARITSEPGLFRRNMRRLIYGKLGLSQPPEIPRTPAARMPWAIRQHGLTGREA
jgi:hypothetical protein